MADTYTSNLALVKPEVGGSRDTWGGKINSNMDAIDAALAASALLTSIKTVDGSGSGLDADLLDGHDAAYFLDTANHTGSVPPSALPDVFPAVNIAEDEDYLDSFSIAGLSGYDLRVATDTGRGAFTRWSADSVGAVLVLAKSRSADIATPTYTALLTDDVLGQIRFVGADGTDLDAVSGLIETKATENWTSAARGTRMTLGVVANGATAVTNALVLDDDNAEFSGAGEFNGLLTVTTDNEFLKANAGTGGQPLLSFFVNSVRKGYIQRVTDRIRIRAESSAGVTTASLDITDAGDLSFYDGSGTATVWHSRNDGSGSGLDADLLDGQDSAYYRSASNLNAGTLPNARLETIVETQRYRTSINGTAAAPIFSNSSDTDTGIYFGGSNDLFFAAGGSALMKLEGGNVHMLTPLLFGRSSTSSSTAGIGTVFGGDSPPFLSFFSSGTSSTQHVRFFNAAGGTPSQVGNISTSGSSTAFNTTSDYRLKDVLGPIDPALIDLIKVYEVEWKSDGSIGHGVLAHELAEVIPHAVTGEKDAVDGEGRIVAQSVDYSKLVPALIAKVQNLEARLAVLEAA